MKTIKGLTKFENEVLDFICRDLASWREDEPGYSCIDGADVTKEMKKTNPGWNARSTSGVVGSLCKKGFLVSLEYGGERCSLAILYPNWEKIPNDFGRWEIDHYKEIIKNNYDRWYANPNAKEDTLQWINQRAEKYGLAEYLKELILANMKKEFPESFEDEEDNPINKNWNGVCQGNFFR